MDPQADELATAAGAVLDVIGEVVVVDQGTDRIEDHPDFPAAAEALGTRLAVGALTQQGEQRITAALDALVQACRTGERVAIADQDLGLHSTIVALSGHRRLGEHYRLVRQQIRLYIAWSDAIMPDVESIIETHRWLVDAILERDADRAASLAHDHCESAGRSLAEFLGERVEPDGKSILLKSK